MRKFFILMLTIILTIGISLSTTFANEAILDEHEVTAQFDLTKGNQTIETVDQDGNTVTITATRVDKGDIILFGSDNVRYGNSTWKIRYRSILSEVEYYMDINVNNSGIATIKEVYDPYYHISTYTVTKTDLRINRATETSTRSAQSEYYFEGYILNTGMGSTNGWLRADIKDMVITTSYK